MSLESMQQNNLMRLTKNKMKLKTANDLGEELKDKAKESNNNKIY